MKKHRLRLGLFGGALVMLVLCWAVVWKGRSTTPVPQAPPPSTNTKLSAADLAFGRQQVDQMMHDRPQMATCVERGDIVYQWAVRQFAGEATGQHIYWIAEVTDSPAAWPLSLSYRPIGSSEGRIFISKQYQEGPDSGQNLSCERLWACAVFELYNISYVNQESAVYQEAIAGKISRQEFTLRLAKIEYDAIQRTIQFYQSAWRPFAKKKSHETTKKYWFADSPDTYEKWIGQYRSDEEYPYGYYNALYDQNVAPYLNK